MANDRNIQIYKEYIAAKGSKKKTVYDVCKKFQITRSTLYDIVRRIEDGNVTQMRKCMEKARLDCLWKHKYQTRYNAIPKNREKESIIMLKQLIREMKADGFSVQKIAEYMKKDRSTISHHLQ